MILFHVFLIIGLCLVMARAAQYVSASVRAVAVSLGFSDFLVAFVFLGFATSAPEISVAVFSALQGTPGLSLGNLLGANIVVLSLLCGTAAIIAGKLSPGDFYRNNMLPLFLIDALLPAYVIADGRLTRIDGVFLTLAHVAFLGHVYRNREINVSGRDTTIGARQAFRRSILIGLLAVVVLLGASYLLVRSGLFVATAAGVSPLLVGLLLFAIGTNVPELSFVLTQARKHKDVVLGDLFGSVMLNTPTVGLLGIISPFTIDQHGAMLAAGIFLTCLTALFGLFMWTKRSLVRREGYVLVACYAVFLGLNAWLQRGA